MADQQDSNVVEIRYCEEDSPKTVSGDETWYLVEVNEFGEWGATYKKVARRPFRSDRQRRKGTTVGVDLAQGFDIDVLQAQHQDLLQGFFVANLEEKAQVVNDAGTEITNVDGVNDDYEGAGLDVFIEGDLIFATGFDDDENNGLKTVASGGSAASCPVEEDLTADASPAQTSGGVRGATLTKVGFEFAADDLAVTTSGSYATYTCTAGDFTDLGLVPGEWIYVGGDTAGAAGNQFPTNAVNNGWKRVKSIAANALVIDKSESDIVTETPAGGETIQIFIGRLYRNRTTQANQIKRTYQFERSLGIPDFSGNPTHIQADYLTGCSANTFQFNYVPEDKVTATLGLVPSGYETVSAGAPPNIKSAVAAAGSGAAPALIEEDAFNTDADFSRLRLAVISTSDEAPTPLFTNLENLTLTINNNINPNKALAVRGSASNSYGIFEVTGSMTGYFEDVASIDAMKDNDDVTLDLVMVKGSSGAKTGIAFDVPLVSLGDGRPNLEMDAKIKLPLTADAASGAQYDTNMDHTLLVNFFDYLPDAADVEI